MMTEFEQFWQRQEGKTPEDRTFAERVWHAAQCAVLRVISNPPYIPKVGEMICYRSLCHPLALGKPKEVTRVWEGTKKVRWLETKYINERGEVVFSSGILGEVEPVSNRE